MPDEHERSTKDSKADQRPAGPRAPRPDYIAGMTDRYAIVEYRRLFDPRERT